jgi:hypothetical protein
VKGINMPLSKIDKALDRFISGGLFALSASAIYFLTTQSTIWTIMWVAFLLGATREHLLTAITAIKDK